MARTITLSAIAVLLVSSGAFAQIDLQYQGWNLGLTNNINLSGGPSEGETIQGVGTLNIQNLGINPDENGDPTAVAAQGIGAALFQSGEVETGGAAMGLVQTLSVVGVAGPTVNGVALAPGQTQMVGDLAGATLQYQGATAAGTQTLTKGVGSAAEAEGLNLVGFGMGQSGGNNCAEGGQLSVILGGQFSELEGQAQSAGTIVTGMTATVTQIQVANGS